MIKHPGPLPDWRCPGFNPLPCPASHVGGVHGQPYVQAEGGGPTRMGRRPIQTPFFFPTHTPSMPSSAH